MYKILVSLPSEDYHKGYTKGKTVEEASTTTKCRERIEMLAKDLPDGAHIYFVYFRFSNPEKRWLRGYRETNYEGYVVHKGKAHLAWNKGRDKSRMFDAMYNTAKQIQEGTDALA